jgi:hypothetical protein
LKNYDSFGAPLALFSVAFEWIWSISILTSPFPTNHISNVYSDLLSSPHGASVHNLLPGVRFAITSYCDNNTQTGQLDPYDPFPIRFLEPGTQAPTVSHQAPWIRQGQLATFLVKKIDFCFNGLKCFFGSADTWIERNTLYSQRGIPIELKLAGFNRLHENSWNTEFGFSLIWATLIWRFT